MLRLRNDGAGGANRAGRPYCPPRDGCGFGYCGIARAGPQYCSRLGSKQWEWGVGVRTPPTPHSHYLVDSAIERAPGRHSGHSCGCPVSGLAGSAATRSRGTRIGSSDAR